MEPRPDHAPRFLQDGIPGAVWRRSVRRRRATRPQRHAELVVLLGLTGSLQYYIDGRLFEIAAGTLLFAPAGRGHFLVSETPDSDIWVLVIAPEVLPKGVDFPAVESGAQVITPTSLTPTAFRELSDLCEILAEESDTERLALGLRWWLSRAWGHRDDSTTEAADSLHPAVGAALRHLRDTPWAALGDVAERSGLSLTRLGVLFRRQTGQTMGRYRTLRRLDLMDSIRSADPGSTLLNAALEAGFTDYSQFYRAYRSFYGRAPSETGSP